MIYVILYLTFFGYVTYFYNYYYSDYIILVVKIKVCVLVSVTDCPLYLVEITVGMDRDDFMERQALRCYQLGVLPLLGTRAICVQPLSGRYVTIEEKNDSYIPCMSLCDITIHAGGYTVS